MSTPSMPEHASPDADWEKMNEYMAVIMPKDFAGAVNLMAHPLAGAAAFSALGFGLASHAYGLWAGAMSGAVEAGYARDSEAFQTWWVAQIRARNRVADALEQANDVTRRVTDSVG